MPAIQRADKQARKRTLLQLVAGAVLGAALFFGLEYFSGGVHSWLEQHVVFLVEHHYLVFVAMLLLVSPLLWLTVFLIRFAGRIVKSERFPPPDTAVIRDVRILEGKSAVLRGRLVQVLCWAILIPAAAIPVLVWYIFYSISCLS